MFWTLIVLCVIFFAIGCAGFVYYYVKRTESARIRRAFIATGAGLNCEAANASLLLAGWLCKASIVSIIVSCVFLAIAANTVKGRLIGLQWMASGGAGTWFVVDNSGGETMRHWILYDSFVESSSQSDGWEFYDRDGNLCYLGGDAFVMKISDYKDFDDDYKEKYNIPKDQEALH